MNVLIVYASVEGQTEKVAEFAADVARKAGHQVTLADADEPTEISYKGVEAVILAAPVHQRRHPPSFEVLLKADKARLSKCRTLLMSISLSAAFPEGMEEAQDYLTEMEMRTGFKPDRELLVGGAVRIGKYDYFAMQVVRHVVLRGRDYDLSSGTHEFTDWEAVRTAVTDFLA